MRNLLKILIFTIPILCIGLIQTSCQQNTKFDSEEWKRNGGEQITLDKRANMVSDLIDSKVLINKTPLEVSELIGVPSKLYNKDNTDHKYYIVQEKYGTDIDPQELIYLEVQYNEKGLSESVSLYSTE